MVFYSLANCWYGISRFCLQVCIWEPQLVPRIDPDDSLTDHSTEALDSDDDCGDERVQRNLSVVSFS